MLVYLDGTTMVRVDMKIVVYNIKYKPSYPLSWIKSDAIGFGRHKV